MNSFFKYHFSYLSYKFHSLVGGKNIASRHDPKITLFRNLKIKNKKLAKDLENACGKKGHLTFAEFLNISIYGENGYHSTHKLHGQSYSYTRWPQALVKICRQKNYDQIIEFGCGDGKLGLETIKIIATSKESLSGTHPDEFSWTGVEINLKEIQNAKAMLVKANLFNSRFQQARTKISFHTSINNVKIPHPSLLVFSYSLDSVPPELFVNTTDTQGPSNAMIGIKIEHGRISEIIIPLSKRRTPDAVHRITLHPWQRICLPLQALETLKTCIQKLPKGSSVLILDEFTPKPFTWQIEDLSVPRDLDKYDPNRKITQFDYLYKTAGENLLYFPTFLEIYVSYLKTLGLKNLVADSEYLGAVKIAQAKSLENSKEKILCYALLANT